MSLLQVQIIRRIFEDFGVSLDDKELIHDLVVNEETLCDFTLPLQVDEEATQKPIWAAELPVAATTVRVILTDLSDDDFREFALAFHVTDLPLYGIRLSQDPEDAGMLCVQSGSDWVQVPIGIQASVLSGIEQLQGYALNWRKARNVDDIHEALISFLNIGEDL